MVCGKETSSREMNSSSSFPSLLRASSTTHLLLLPSPCLPRTKRAKKKDSPPRQLLNHIPQTQHHSINQLCLLVERQPSSSSSSSCSPAGPSIPLRVRIMYDRPSRRVQPSLPSLYRWRRRRSDQGGYGWKDVSWFGSSGRGRAMPVLVVDDFAVSERDESMR